MIRSILTAGLLASTFIAVPAIAEEQKVKNIIVMIADGAGFNTLDATRFWTGAPLVLDGNGFLTTAMSVYPLRNSTTPIPGPAGLAQDPNAVYSSASNYNTTPVAGSNGIYPKGFQGYDWNRATFPDSGNTATSVVTGTKTYNNAINVNGNGDDLITLAEVSVAYGREAGVVSTVAFGDATPSAGGGAHNITRNDRQTIANEMFGSGVLSVIGGAGSPDFDDNGVAPLAPNYSWVSPALWADLKDGTNTSGFNGQGWTLYQNASDIQAIANSTLAAPNKLAMIGKAFNGLDQYRGGLTASTDDPFTTPLRTDVPTLTDLSIAALNRLNEGEKGLYLLAEEGEVDRAMHANNLGRMIEAYIEFNAAVQAVIDWVDSGDSKATWGNTLLIVTADHDHLLFGPDAATDPYQDLVDNGAGVLPGHRWFSGSHSNQLIPLFAKGSGAEHVIALADDVDSYTDGQGRQFGRGLFTDQAELGRYLLGAATVPEPSTWAMLIAGFGFVGVMARRRRTVGVATATA
jgi:alkaline phosphatase